MGFPRKILFVCYANERRSVTAELVFKQMLVERGYEISKSSLENKIQIDSAGVAVNPQDYNTKQMTEDIGDFAEKIFTFSKNLEICLEFEYKQSPSKIINLEIPDIWQCGHPILMNTSRRKLMPYVLKWYLLLK